MSLQFSIASELLALNAYAGVSKKQLRGRNAAISNSAETVWGPGATYAQLTTAVALEAVSSSANDTAAGTGARTISVDLIDGNYAPTTVAVTLNGATPVAITGTFLAVNGARILTAGSGTTNAGTIDIRAVSGGAIKRQITTGATLGLGRSADFLFTIPASYIGLLSSISFSTTGGTGDITVYLNSLNSSGLLRNEGAGKIAQSSTSLNQGFGTIDFGRGLRLEEKTLIELRAIASAGAGDLVAMGEIVLFNTAVCAWVS